MWLRHSVYVAAATANQRSQRLRDADCYYRDLKSAETLTRSAHVGDCWVTLNWRTDCGWLGV